MKKLEFTLYVTNTLELITGLDLVKDVDLRLSGMHLVAGEGVKLPVCPKDYMNKAVCAKLDALFTDTFLLEDLNANVVVSAPEGIMFIGDSDLVMEFFRYIKVGKAGMAAATDDVSGFPRAFWCTDDTSLMAELLAFLDKGPDGAKPEGKPAAKPVKKSSAPAAKPAAKPAKKATTPAVPTEEPVPEKEPFAVATNARSLEELFALTAPGPDDDAGESAEQTVRRLCKEEGIECDIADSDSDSEA